MMAKTDTLAITVPTCVRWRHDRCVHANGPVTLSASFSDLDLAPLPRVGHFPHREDPDRAAVEIAAFFQRLGWR